MTLETRVGGGRVTLMGFPIDAFDEAEAVSTIVEGALEGRGGLVVTPNVDHLRRLQLDAHFRHAYERADVVLADGMPLVWASRLQGPRLPCRVAGSNLLWSLSAAAADVGLPIFLLGGRPGSADATAKVLLARSPHLRIVGCAVPEVGFEKDPRQLERLVEDIREATGEAASGIVFLALGTPKQELLAARLVDTIHDVWLVGVGAAFDMAAGRVRRAPSWAQRSGLEWLFRLAQEPKRLFRRYVIEDAPFTVKLFTASAKERWRARTVRQWPERRLPVGTRSAVAAPTHRPVSHRRGCGAPRSG